MIVDLKKVTKNYRDCTGVSELDLEVPQGQIVGLLGLNGSGKTTLMKIISGLYHPDSGTALLMQRPPRTGRKHVSFMGDWQGYPLWMTPRDIAKFMTTFHDDFDVELYDRLRSELEIPVKPLERISRGEKQKLILIATVARKTDLYLLDEPLSGIDIISRREILKCIMSSWNETSSIILATHEINEIEPFLDRVIFLASGRIIADEKAEEIHRESLSVADRFINLMGEKR